MPKVSIVIPTYNRAHFVAESIRSVLDQTFADFEVIVVDDGSTDNTREVVDSLQDTRIRYIYQENQGVAAARNAGIKASRGEYIFFLDSDDAVLGNTLEKGLEVLDMHPEVAFSHGQAYWIDKRGRVFGKRKNHDKCTCIREGIVEIRHLIVGKANLILPMMIRRSCLFKVGLFDPALSSGSEDRDLWIRLAKKYAVAYIAEPLAKIRMHSGGINATRTLDEIEKTNSLILERLFNDPELGHILSSERPKAYFNLYSRLARRAYEGGKTGTARKYLFRALKMHPDGFFKSLCLPWIYQFAKSCIPLPVLHSIREARRYMGRVTLHTYPRFKLLVKKKGKLSMSKEQRGWQQITE